MMTGIAHCGPGTSTSAVKPWSTPAFRPPSPETGRQQGEQNAMAQDISGAAAGGGATLVVPGEMAARIDRLPRSFMLWEIALLV